MKVKTISIVVGALLAIAAVIAALMFLNRSRPVEVKFENPENDGKTVVIGKKILMVHSYHKEWGWDIDMEKGIVDGLSAKGYVKDRDYEFKNFFMDTKVTYTLPGQIKVRGDQAVKYIEDYKPDLVFINDDNAFNFVAVPYSVKHAGENLPFIFAGINGDPSASKTVIDSLEKPGHNVTGALERFPYFEGFSLVKRIFPNAKTAVLFADSSESSNSVIAQLKRDGADKDPKMPIKIAAIVQVDTFADWQKKITEYQSKADVLGILTYHQLKGDNGKVVDASEVVIWTINHNKLPEIGFLLFHAEDGFLSAVGASAYKNGQYIGKIGGDVLSGKNPGDVPIIDPKLVDIAFNLERVKMLGVSIPLDILSLATQTYTEIKKPRF